MVNSAKFGVELQADVVDLLSAFVVDESIFFEDDLGRDAEDGVAQSLDSRVYVALFARHQDHDQVDFSFLFEIFVERNEILFLRGKKPRL